jgi:hypothetical protein
LIAMLAADRDFIDFDALRNGAPALASHTPTARKFVARRPPMLSYWEVLLPFAPSQALIVVRFGVEGEDAPTLLSSRSFTRSRAATSRTWPPRSSA